MIPLIPSWADQYDEFWKTLRKRNLWIIKLRYGAAFMLAGFILIAEFVLGFNLTFGQFTALVVISLSILTYNLILHYLRRYIKCSPESFNPLHLAIMQMVLDLIALFLLCRYTGMIESPLFMLFVFHMIIGSLILPGIIIYSVAVSTILVFTLFTYLEYFGVLAHYSIKGLLTSPLYSNISFVNSYLIIFAFVIIMCVFITNKIAHELYSMEQKLLQSLDKIKAAETEKQKYIMGVVHEIKTPLTAMHSYLDVILDKYLGPLDEKIEEKLIRARTRSLEAITLIEDVLKISRIKLLDELHSEDIDVKDLICQITEKQSSTIQNKSIQLHIIDKRKTPAPLKADRFLLELALSNLINNAVKYTGENGEIRIDLMNSSGRHIIKISDSGIGIPEQDLKNIFKDFYRASNIRHKEYNGTGLGLAIVKQIMDKHNGEITVVSPSGIGTKENPGAAFTLFLTEKNI